MEACKSLAVLLCGLRFEYSKGKECSTECGARVYSLAAGVRSPSLAKLLSTTVLFVCRPRSAENVRITLCHTSIVSCFTPSKHSHRAQRRVVGVKPESVSHALVAAGKVYIAGDGPESDLSSSVKEEGAFSVSAPDAADGGADE